MWVSRPAVFIDQVQTNQSHPSLHPFSLWRVSQARWGGLFFQFFFFFCWCGVWIGCQVDAGVPLQVALSQHDTWLKERGVSGREFAVVTWSDWDCKVMLEAECKWRGIQKPLYFNRWGEGEERITPLFNRWGEWEEIRKPLCFER